MNRRETTFNLLNIIICILISINVIGWFVVKDHWVADASQGWTTQISKVLYGMVLVFMTPSVFWKSKRTIYAKLMVIYLCVSLYYGYYSDNYIDWGVFSKKMLIVFSFIYFDVAIKEEKISKSLLNWYIITMAVYVFNNVIRANVLGTALETGKAMTGQGTSISIIYLIPLVACIWKPKYIGYFFIFSLVVCVISLRRTSIIACLLFFPFMYKYLKQSISKRIAIYVLVLLCGVSFYVVTNYWEVLELRFSDMFTPTEYNETYGSGRSRWFMLLIKRIYNSGNPLLWFWGYGIGAAGDVLIEHGYTFRDTHSDYIELFHDMGLVGMFLFYIFFIRYSIRVYKASLRYKPIVAMTFLVIMFIGSVSTYINNPTGIAIPIFYNLILHKSSLLRSNGQNVNSVKR